MSKDRGFKKLVGKTIEKVNAKAINEVLLVGEDGYHYVIEAEVGPLGIPVISLKKLDLTKDILPEGKLRPMERARKRLETKSNDRLWPFPPESVKEYD
jgi:hypothetical protein